MPTFTEAHYVLAVPNAEATAAWWIEVMGFDHWATVPGWVFVRRGACVLRLGSCPDETPPGDLGDHSYFGYVVVDDVDALHAEIALRGATILRPPHDEPWDMREMAVRTPDGHRIMFAAEIG